MNIPISVLSDKEAIKKEIEETPRKIDSMSSMQLLGSILQDDEYYFRNVPIDTDLNTAILSAYEKTIDAEDSIDTRIKNIEQRIRSFGVCCFSWEGLSDLMFAHYADDHKGLVFGFDVDSLIETFGPGYEVKYVENTPKITIKNIAETVYTKHSKWNYEAEFRLFSRKAGTREFNDSALKEVIFGAKVTDDTANKVLNDIHKNFPSIKAFRCTMGSGFSLERVPL